MFQEELQEIVNRSKGAAGALVMGLDGIAVDQYVRSEPGIRTQDGRPMDMETLGMELSVVLKNLRNTVDSLEVGSSEEFFIRAQNLSALVRFLGREYFLALALEPSGNVGKARFLMRTRGLRMLETLEA